jgi:hypothetical protein
LRTSETGSLETASSSGESTANLPHTLSARCRFAQGTFVGAARNDEAAPKPAVRGAAMNGEVRPVSSLNSDRDQASALGAGTGSDCGGATRERGRPRLAFVGSEAASFTASDFDRERVVRLGLGVRSTSPPAASTFSSPFATADSADIGSRASSAFGLRPSPSCFARVDRCSE